MKQIRKEINPEGRIRMGFKDRLLLVKRAVLLALNPRTAVVGVNYQEVVGTLGGGDQILKGVKRVIFTNEDVAFNFYLNCMVKTFTGHAKSGGKLVGTLVNFIEQVQDGWNTENPDDKVSITHNDLTEPEVEGT